MMIAASHYAPIGRYCCKSRKLQGSELFADSYSLRRVTEVACAFNVRRGGPPHSYTKTEPTTRRIFDHQCKTTFATISAISRICSATETAAYSITSSASC